MPAGQAFTVWFPGVIEMLKLNWSKNHSIPQHFNLVNELNVELKRIREFYNVQPPMFYCKMCKKRERSKFTNVTLTSMYYALKRFELIEEEYLKKLLKDWKKYSKENNIDIYQKYKDWNKKRLNK